MRDFETTTSIQRLFALRQHPGFQDADLSELATMAENLVETTFAAGQTVVAAGMRVPAIHLVIEGELASMGGMWGPRQPFGVLEVLANRPVATDVIATVTTRTFQLAAHDLVEILEDSGGLMANARRGVARHVLRARARRPRSVLQQAVPTGALVGLVERLIVLRQQFPFGTLPALAALAHAAREVVVSPGEVVRNAGDQGDAMFIVLSGALRGHGDSVVLGPGEAFGMLETFAEQPHASTYEAITEARALHVSAMALFDVMEDHTELALGVLALLAGELLDAHVVDDTRN